MKHFNLTQTLKAYYSLTKPGIIRGNLITAIAGFLLAAKGDVDFQLFFGMLAGLALVIASACVFNNYTDQSIDAKMDRTKARVMVSGLISDNAALWYASLLGIAGSLVLINWTNYLSLVTALAGLFAYVVLYGYAKRKSVYGTLVGSISGSTPPVVGYVAVTGQYDIAAAILFLIVAVWQMPHFYAIAIYRSEDYRRAGLPVLPVVSGNKAAIRHILTYQVLFIACAPLLYLAGYTGMTYLIVSLIAAIAWAAASLTSIRSLYKHADAAQTNKQVDRWARQVFLVSLLVIVVQCVAISIG